MTSLQKHKPPSVCQHLWKHPGVVNSFLCASRVFPWKVTTFKLKQRIQCNQNNRHKEGLEITCEEVMMLGCWSAPQIQPEGNQHQSNKFLFFVWVNNSFVNHWPFSAWPLWLSCVSMEGDQNYLGLCHARKPISWILSHFKYYFIVLKNINLHR